MSKVIFGSGFSNGIGGGEAQNIREADQFHALNIVTSTTEELNIDLESGGGQIGTTMSESPGGKVRITFDSIHGLSANDLINCVLTSFSGPTLATTIVSTTIVDTDVTWDAESHAGTTVGYARRPTSWNILPGMGGWYYYWFSVMGGVLTGTGVTAALKLFIDTSAVAYTYTWGFFPVNEMSAVPNFGMLKLNSGDRVWIGISNEEDTTDISIFSGNFGLRRIGG